MSDWEKDKSAPPQDRLPTIARALGVDLDEHFRRYEAPNLADLRADAGLTQGRAAEKLGITRLPLSHAETGRKPLPSGLFQRVAVLYGVTPDELSAAQDRSLGISTPSRSQVQLPTAPCGQVSLFDVRVRRYLTSRPMVSNEDVAAAINRAAGASISPADIEDLRNGARGTESVFAGLPEGPVREGLAVALGVAPYDFLPDEQVAQEALDRLLYLTSERGGDGLTLAARGESKSIAPEMMAKVSELLVRWVDRKPKEKK
ncbi:hypothetical protein GCM10020000_86500 [Streptomyces olivoverticillatus]